MKNNLLKIILIISLGITTVLAQDNAEELLNKSKVLMQKKEFKKACDLLKSIKSDKHIPQKEFLLAQCKFALQDFAGAAFHYELMLEKNTNLPRVRLDLARTLMAMGKSKAAKEEFEKVLSMKLPSNVRRNIEEQLVMLDMRKRWGGVAALGYMYDSNVNSAPSNSDILAFGLPFTLDSNSLERDSRAFLSSLSFGKYFDAPLADEWRMDFFGNIVEYANEEAYDNFSLGVSLTPNYYLGKYNISIPISFSSKWEAEEHSADSFSVSPSVIVSLNSRLKLVSGISFSNEESKLDNSTADGNIFGVNANLRYSIDKFSVAEVGLNYTNNNANEVDHERYDSYRISIGYSKFFANGIGTSIQPSYAIVKYEDIDFVDNGVMREDKRLGVSVNIYKNISIKQFDFTPILSYTYTDNNSNISRRDYKKHQVSLQIRKQF